MDEEEYQTFVKARLIDKTIPEIALIHNRKKAYYYTHGFVVRFK